MTGAVLDRPPPLLTPARAGASASPGGGRVTLEERLGAVLQAVRENGGAECPVCHARMTAGERGAECGDCGAQLG